MADETQESEELSYVARPVDPDRPELGHLARWTVSTHKYGYGVENLRDDNENTFWQSEGPQPHTIDLTFPKRVLISAVALRTSHPRDDSYTPSKISIRAGSSIHDLQEVQVREFSKPDGWLHIPLRPNNSDGGDDHEEEEGPPIPCYHLRVYIIANHMLGKDTHVRGLKVYGPLDPTSLPNSTESGPSETGMTAERSGKGGTSKGKKLLNAGHDGLSGFTSVAFKMHEALR